MHLTRRSLLAAALALPAISGRAQAPRTLRVGYQKGEALLMAARRNQAFEKAIGSAGWRISWTEFQFGPPMLEAMRAGSIDVGGVGDTPPIFAQAAHADLVYTAGSQADAEAILLPPDSPIHGLQDLKGRRVAFSRGSSAHNFLLMVLEKAGLAYDQIQPVALGPADASAAFQRGAVDAWSIWDPYFALFESRPGVRVLCTNKDIGPQNTFIMASRGFATANPAITGHVVEALIATAAWAGAHRPQVAGLLSDATGLPEPVMQRVADRIPFITSHMDAGLVRSQQRVADRFHQQGLIPTAINVASAVFPANA